ncbi:MAG: VWA domain-containing protein, partial [Solirubrobacterales bacterium]|nr:VWA domain-containing protein [Solirubrobacterales bacterium]
ALRAMTFLDPLVLLGLLALPLLAWWYRGQQRRRVQAASAFVAPRLTESVAPRGPRWRRHLPMLVFGLALAALIVAASRPQRSVAQPVTNGAVMLADDTSSSMQATDVAPSRLGAALRAAQRFLAHVPSPVQVGLLEFARRPTVLQSPTTDHALTKAALAQLPRTSGGTAVGVALTAALNELRGLRRVDGKRPPGAIVLISDGASNVGISPLGLARQAASARVPIYTISVGTPSGTIPGRSGGQSVRVPVPVDRGQLSQIARLSGGKAFTASDSAGVSAAYDRLAARLGKKYVKQEITASVVGIALALLIVGSVLTLRWFGRLV